MIKSIEYKGDWKLPNQEEWIKGTLTYSPNEGAVLEIHGTFNTNFVDRKPQDIILGKTTGGIITLLNCHYSGVKTQLETKITIGRYLPRQIIKGKHYEKMEDIKFSKVIFSLFNLFEWFNTSGLSSELKSKNVDLKYERPEGLGPFPCDERCSLALDFSYQIETGAENRQFRLMEDVKVTLEYKQDTGFEVIIKDIHILENFVTIAVFERSYPMSIVFIAEQSQHECIYRSTGYDSRHIFRHNGLHILQYSSIKDDFPTILKNWFTSFKQIEPVFNLLLYSFRDKLKISEDKFMDLCRALEIFHRKVVNTKPFTEAEFNHLYLRTVYNVFERDQKWLARALTHANNHDLLTRLHNLRKRYPTKFLDDRVEDKNDFFTRVVATRNYYTHYNEKQEPKAFKKGDLYKPTKFLIALLISCIYQHIGISKSHFEENMNDATM